MNRDAIAFALVVAGALCAGISGGFECHCGGKKSGV